MLGINQIHDKDGKLLDKILEEIKSGLGGKGSADLKDYAKASDVKELKTMVEELIADLQAGKYNFASEKTEIKEDKKAEK